jgi:GAF domain-containing protein
MSTEEYLAEVFVQIADALMAESDVVDFGQRFCDHSVQLLGVDAAALMLADPQGRLEVLASTREPARSLGLFELRVREGPGLDCHRAGRLVEVPDVTRVVGCWARFAPRCRRAGFAAVHAIPMRHGEQVIGAMNLYRTAAGRLDPATARIARRMAAVATIGLLQHRALHGQELLIEQLQTALDSRVVIEQAKGILAERFGTDTDTAFAVLRRRARDRSRPLAELARAVVAGRGPHAGPDGPRPA